MFALLPVKVHYIDMTNSNYLRETVDLIKQIETRFLELGARLYTIREKKLWDGTYDSYQEFLDTAHVSAGNASILASIHHHYVVEGHITQEKLAGVGYSSLYQAIPLIAKNGVEKAVVMATTLTRQEIIEEVREGKHGECFHSETIHICKNCHKKI